MQRIQDQQDQPQNGQYAPEDHEYDRPSAYDFRASVFISHRVRRQHFRTHFVFQAAAAVPSYI